MNTTSPQLAAVVSLPFGENTYIAHFTDRSDAIVIDPGLEPDKIFAYLSEKTLTPSAIICTHAHMDHIGGNQALKNRWPDLPIVIGQGEAHMLTDPMENLSGQFGMPMVSPPADETVAEGDIYRAAGFELEVLEVPGHSPGHVVFLVRGNENPILFGGDTLFEQSIGRTDFPHSNHHDLIHNIHSKLFRLPPETVVLPGHGDSTTIGAEIEHNPFVGKPAGYRPE